MNNLPKNNSFVCLMRRHTFIQVLKFVRDKLKAKESDASGYYLILTNSYMSFLRRVISAIKESHLKRMSLTYNYKSNLQLFFKQMRLIKERRRQKHINSLIRNKLRYKVFKLLAEHMNRIRNDRNSVYLLLQMNDRYYSNLLFKHLNIVNKAKRLKSKTKEYLLRLSLIRLIKHYHKENTLREIERKQRKFRFKHFTTQGLTFIRREFEAKRPLVDRTRFFQYKIFLSTLQKIVANKHDKEEKRRFFLESKRKTFIKRIKKKIYQKQTIADHLEKTVYIIDICTKKGLFTILKNIYNITIDNEGKKTKYFFQRISLKKFKRNKGKSLHNEVSNKIESFRSKLYFTIFSFHLKMIKQKLKSQTLSNQNLNKINFRLKDKLLLLLSNHHEYMTIKKNKYITCLLTYRANAIKRTIRGFKLFMALTKVKKESYTTLIRKREEIISSKLLEVIFTKTLNNIRKREELISQIFIQRNTKGVKLALTWLRKLKMLVHMNKTCLNKTADLPMKTLRHTIQLDMKLIEEDVQLLISLRNKKRLSPISYDDIFN